MWPKPPQANAIRLNSRHNIKILANNLETNKQVPGSGAYPFFYFMQCFGIFGKTQAANPQLWIRDFVFTAHQRSRERNVFDLVGLFTWGCPYTGPQPRMSTDRWSTVELHSQPLWLNMSWGVVGVLFSEVQVWSCLEIEEGNWNLCWIKLAKQLFLL